MTTGYAGDRFVGISTDSKPTNVLDGAMFTEINVSPPKTYFKLNGSWIEGAGGTVDLSVISGNLEATGRTLYNYYAALSGNLSQTGSRLQGGLNILSGNLGTTGSNLLNYSIGGDTNLSGNLTQTGNTFYGFFSTLSGNLSNTGARLQGGLNILSGNLGTTGSNLSNYLVGGDTNLSGNLTQTGNTFYGFFSTLSGNLSATGSRLQGGINILSGNLGTTGSNLYNYIIGGNTNLSGDLYTTGSNLYNYFSTLSGNLSISGSRLQGGIDTLSGNLTTTGIRLQVGLNIISGNLGTTGSNLYNYIIGGDSNLSGNLGTTGSNLYNYFSNLSGNLSNSGSRLQGGLNILSGNLGTTGSNLYNYLIGGDTNLSGNLFTTGSNLYNYFSTLSGNLSISGSRLQGGIDTLSGNLTTTGIRLQGGLNIISGNLGTTGSNLFNSFIGGDQNLSGNLTNSGSRLQGGLNQLSGDTSLTGKYFIDNYLNRQSYQTSSGIIGQFTGIFYSDKTAATNNYVSTIIMPGRISEASLSNQSWIGIRSDRELRFQNLSDAGSLFNHYLIYGGILTGVYPNAYPFLQGQYGKTSYISFSNAGTTFFAHTGSAGSNNQNISLHSYTGFSKSINIDSTNGYVSVGPFNAGETSPSYPVHLVGDVYIQRNNLLLNNGGVYFSGSSALNYVNADNRYIDRFTNWQNITGIKCFSTGYMMPWAKDVLPGSGYFSALILPNSTVENFLSDRELRFQSNIDGAGGYNYTLIHAGLRTGLYGTTNPNPWLQGQYGRLMGIQFDRNAGMSMFLNTGTVGNGTHLTFNQNDLHYPVHINTAGNVAIGINASLTSTRPAYPIDLNGNTNVQGNFLISGIGIATVLNNNYVSSLNVNQLVSGIKYFYTGIFNPHPMTESFSNRWGTSLIITNSNIPSFWMSPIETDRELRFQTSEYGGGYNQWLVYGGIYTGVSTPGNTDVLRQGLYARAISMAFGNGGWQLSVNTGTAGAGSYLSVGKDMNRVIFVDPVNARIGLGLNGTAPSYTCDIGGITLIREKLYVMLPGEGTLGSFGANGTPDLIQLIYAGGASYLRGSTYGPLAVQSQNNHRIAILPGLTGASIGNLYPDARFAIESGNNFFPTLRLQPGTLCTNVTNGGMEFDGSHLYFGIGSTRYQIDQQSSSGPTANTGVINPVITITNWYSGKYTDNTILGKVANISYGLMLPDTSGVSGQIYRIKLIRDSVSETGALTISGIISAQQIDNESNYVLTNRNESITLISDKTFWRIL